MASGDYGTRVELFPQRCVVKVGHTRGASVGDRGRASLPPFSQVLRGGDNAAVDTDVPALIPRSLGVPGVLNFLCAHEGVLAALHAPEVSRSSLRLWLTPPQAGAVEEPFVAPAKLEEVTMDDSEVLALTLEVRSVDGSWPKGPVPFPSVFDPVPDGASWTLGVKEGSYVDAKDSEGNWYASRVLRVKTSDGVPAAASEDDMLHVHFFGWTDKWDLDVARSEECLAPLFSKTRAWQHGVRPGDRIEVRRGEETLEQGRGGESRCDEVSHHHHPRPVCLP